LRLNPTLSCPQQQSEDQLDRDPAIWVGDELSFIDHHQAQLIEQSLGSESEVKKSLVGKKTKIVAAG
jgi:hypothetical protein